MLFASELIEQSPFLRDREREERKYRERREMAEPACIDLSRVPYIPGRLHATNNQFQRFGPKGFMETKVLENDNLYVRVDLPGVPDDAIRHRVDAVRQKVVFFSGETLGDGDKNGVREYSGTAGLGCDCCEITGVDAKMKDGVLRMILSRVKVKNHEKKCILTLPPNTGSNPFLPQKSYLLHIHYCKYFVCFGYRQIWKIRIDEYIYGRTSLEDVEDHPFVVKGRKGTFVSERTAEGDYCLSVDLPGVSSDDIFVLPNENEVKFYAENKNVYEHDESGRIFMGAVRNSVCCAPGLPLLSHNIAWDAEFGVLKVRISPPRNNTNSE